MAKRKATGFKFLGLMFLLLGIKVQRPVRRVKRSRSLKYKVICKLLAGHGKRGRRTSKFGKKRTTFKRRAGAR